MREIKFRAVMQRLDGVKYVSQAYSIDNNLSYLFDFENNRWDIFLEMITTEERFVELFPDDDEHLKGWTHIENIQYTGLKDKHGIEIYEADIVKYKYTSREQVAKIEFNNEKLGFDFVDKHVKLSYAYNFRQINSIEVIGNIYENPELLKELNGYS